MGQISEFEGDAIMREWLQKLCAKGITRMNIGHIPGLWGVMAAVDYLEKKTNSLPYDDHYDSLERQILFMYFRLSADMHYSKLSEFFLTGALFVERVDKELDHIKGFTFDFSAYATVGFVRCNLPGASELAEKLADEFAKGYFGN